MSVLKLQKQPAKERVESWDDDMDFHGVEDLQLRSVSSTTAFSTASSRPYNRHRDSISSRLSGKSNDDDQDWQVLLGDNDPTNAITSAKLAGIPIPIDTPTSALMGGTIKKLGSKQMKPVSKEDWDDDMDWSVTTGNDLKLEHKEKIQYPTELRNTSASFPQAPNTSTRPTFPPHQQATLNFQDHLKAMGQNNGNAALDRFNDNDDDDVFGDAPAITIAKQRSPQRQAGFYALPHGNKKSVPEEESFDDLEFPEANKPLRLSLRKEVPVTPTHQMPADLEIEGMESSASSFGVSVGSSRPTGKSNRSSSITALSPSVFSPTLSSCMTAGSEEDGLDGLVLPEGPLKFAETLKKRLETASPEQQPEAKRSKNETVLRDDFFSDLDIGDGKVFEAPKLTLNRNIKVKAAAKATSPSRRPATSITFTNKPSAVITRIPKPSPSERPRSKMETISESGVPVPLLRRSTARIPTHSAQSSVSSLPTPTTPTFIPPSVPSTPSRRGLGTKSSREQMKVELPRLEPTTTGAQLLKLKRSMPALRSQTSPQRQQPAVARPPSRGDRTQRSNMPSRPKTPIDRVNTESRQGIRKPPVPFLPSGNASNSHHVAAKQTRFSDRPGSSDSTESTAHNRPLSRLSSAYRPRTPGSRKDVASEPLARQAAAKRTLTKPLRRRGYGDGTELDAFDDLPTQKEQESRLNKRASFQAPINPPQPGSRNLRKLQSVSNLSATQRSPLSPTKTATNVPSFARETAASRMAREQPSFARETAASRMAREQRQARQAPQPPRPVHASENNLHARFRDQHLTPSHIPANQENRAPAKIGPPPPRQLRRAKKPSKPLQLIQNLGASNAVKPQKGMHYNPRLFRWEGNENAVEIFDAPSNNAEDRTHMSNSPLRRGPNGTSKPALIANFGQTKGVQVVGGMVFDPARMCWLKLDPKHRRGRSDTVVQTPSAGNPHPLNSSGSIGGGTGSVTTATEDDEDDPFAGLPDLEDERKVASGAGAKKAGLEESDEEMSFGVGEEFDVGPEFVRRQRHEEDRARRKLAGWEGFLGMGWDAAAEREKIRGWC